MLLAGSHNQPPSFAAWLARRLRQTTNTDCTLMALSSQDIARIAHLARLELTDAEAETMRDQLNGFFSLVEQMQAVNTEGVAPLKQPLEAIEAVELRLREDVVTASDVRDASQLNAPAVQDGLFLVPRVVE
jgi:aspartyl-tRNA(Asn)/glutamyl-tRNA(Gln) amidotransferase subunit C